MKTFYYTFFIILIPISVSSFTDESHYSIVFGTTRNFRVFTPPDYDHKNSSKKYPVIYYFHGCGGSYRRSGTYSYADYGLPEPRAINRAYNSDYGFPNNAEFENVAFHNNVIIVCLDGRLDDLPDGCKVYFPSQADTWEGDYYNFSLYIRELIDVVDLRYHTKVGPQFRAVSGLSMGGQMAIWVAATNPHLFSSASQFCHSPSYYDVGQPTYLTTIDVRQLWRNLRGLPFRHLSTDRDYLRYYTSQLYETYSGAGFTNEHYLADFCKHYAARIDLQFDFHIKQFSKPKGRVPCFSYVNLYPDFEVWGYKVSTSKTGNGWIYLHDVTKNGLGIYTRERLPWGKSLPEFNISVSTPPIYNPKGNYILARYSYRDHSFSRQNLIADSQGKLTITSSGGLGEEIGILGDELQPPVFVLSDTINETIYLKDHVEMSVPFDVVNLSNTTQAVDFIVSTENDELLNIVNQPKQLRIPALFKMNISSFLVIRGKYIENFQNTGYVKINSVIDGIVQEREHIIQVVVEKPGLVKEPIGIKVFDGKSEALPLHKYAWNQWDNPISSGNISEGIGNGNGKPELGETFSIWIATPSLQDSANVITWHPTVPINSKENAGIIVNKIKQHRNSTGRSILSAQMQLTRNPTKINPVSIPLQTEILKVQRLENDCHRNTADNFTYSYYNIVLYEDGTVGMENTQ